MTVSEKDVVDVTHRLVTIVCCDIENSTVYAENDKEKYRQAALEFHHICTEITNRYDAEIKQCPGDAIIAFMGSRLPYENSAERAVHLGLALTRRFATQPTSTIQLNVRVGIATDQDIVGDNHGPEATPGSGSFGVTIPVAYQLQSMAEPNGIVISDATRGLIGEAFEL